MTLTTLKIKLQARARNCADPPDNAAGADMPTVVPWRAIRRKSGRLKSFMLQGADVLWQVRVLVVSPGLFAQSFPTAVRRGESLKLVTAFPEAAAHKQTAVVRWIDSQGREMLWSTPVY